MSAPPDVVRATIEVVDGDEGREVIAILRDLDGVAVTFGTTRQVANWLDDHNFVWCVASRGLWRRNGKVARCSSS